MDDKSAECQHEWRYYETEHKVFGGLGRYYEMRRMCQKCWTFEKQEPDWDKTEPLVRVVYKWVKC